MVRMKDIPGDYYFFDEQQYALIGERTNNMYQLGDLIQIKVEKADVVKRQIDFSIVHNEN